MSPGYDSLYERFHGRLEFRYCGSPMLMENVGMVENIRNGGMVDGLVLQVVQLLVDRAGTGRRGPLYRYTGSFFMSFSDK